MDDLGAAAPYVAALLDRLQLTIERRIDENESFVILLCRRDDGRRLVLKLLRSDSPDGRRRLKNEVLLTRHVPTEAPLRLLTYRGHGAFHLLTDFDTGELLQPDRLKEPVVRRAVVGALLRFQGAPVDTAAWGLVDREPLSWYYVKVLLRNILHLWPGHLSTLEAFRSLIVLAGALPTIRRHGVLCHGDFLPTNLLFHAEDGTVTFTDLEGSLTHNHPLFDVIAHFTIDPGEIGRWEWQREFLHDYLERGGARLGLQAGSAELASAYRGLLVFFLVYRLSEARVNLLGTTYFAGLGRWRFLGRRAAEVARNLGRPPLDRRLDDALAVRRANLGQVLSARGWREHRHAILPRCRSEIRSAKVAAS